MFSCSACSGIIHREEPASAAFTKKGRGAIFTKAARKRPSISPDEGGSSVGIQTSQVECSRLGGVQSQEAPGSLAVYLHSSQDEDICCPDCGLKIARHEGLTCTACGAHAIVVGVEATKMVFTHRQPLFKLLLHCTEKGEDSTSYAISSGFTPVAITSGEGRNSGFSSDGHDARIRAEGKSEERTQSLTVRFEGRLFSLSVARKV